MRFRAGIDENGLGSLLGPMLTTAVLTEVSDKGKLTVEGKVRGKLKERLGDSKALVAHGDVDLAEAWTRVLVRKITGREPQTIEDIVRAVSLDEEAALKSRCPTHVEAQCWNTEEDAFSATAAELAQAATDLELLEKKGVKFLAVRSVISCNKKLNLELDQGRSRFAVDLHSMERLVLSFVSDMKEPVFAVCGKVGGYRQYEPAFGPLSGHLRTVLQEERSRSAYHFPGVGELHFVEDADASDMLVSMASLVGKYLREALMDRVGRHYRALDATLPVVSGYHDPVTTKFVAATKLLRKKRKVDDDCFLRRKLG